MIIGLLVAVIGLIVLLNNGSPIWGYGLIITGAILACFLPFTLIILNAKTRIKTYKELTDFYDYSMKLLTKRKFN